MDVVPTGDEDRWRHPPWQATEVNGRIYGRGSSDMKGGLCCALFVAKALRDAGVFLKGRLLDEDFERCLRDLEIKRRVLYEGAEDQAGGGGSGRKTLY